MYYDSLLKLVDDNFYWMYVVGFLYAFLTASSYEWFLAEFICLTSIVFILKRMTLRQRPDKSDNYSFPSGHTAMAWFLAFKIPHPITFIWASLVSYSRVYLQRHWWSDVIFGFTLTVGINFLFSM